jgi:hypothetical protein
MIAKTVYRNKFIFNNRSFHFIVKVTFTYCNFHSFRIFFKSDANTVLDYTMYHSTNKFSHFPAKPERTFLGKKCTCDSRRLGAGK